jgi:hypothetical protein
MNVMIYDHSEVPDILYQQRIRQLFGALADATVRFVNGILDAAWHIRYFRPDVIVFDWIGDCKPIRTLVTTLHRINPGVAMFHLDGGSFIVTTGLCGLPAGPAVPQWLHNIASDWIFARCAPVPTSSPMNDSGEH